MTINITKEHIAAAKRRDSHHCMIADAIRDRVDGKYVLVDAQSIRWSDPEKDRRYTYLTPAVAQKAIIAFDRGAAVRPFSFHLSTPILVEPMRHFPESDPKTIQKARRNYERRTRKRGKKSARGYTREREYGVRILQA